MNIDKCKTFLVVARCQTFFDAAEELFITPATVSKHIASLEKELGVVLFTRTPHGIVLTEEGKRKVPYMEQMVRVYETMVGQNDVLTEEKTVLTVLAAPPPSRFGVEKIVRAFKKDCPNIQLDIREIRGATNALISGECELGFLSDQHLDSALLRWMVVQKTELGVVLPVDHALAKRESVSISELSRESFILPTPEIGAVSRYIEMCRAAGFEPEIGHYCYRDDSSLFYVSCGDGITFMARDMFQLFNYEHARFVPLKEDYYSSGVLARPRNHVLSSAASCFWDYVKKKFSIQQ